MYFLFEFILKLFAYNNNSIYSLTIIMIFNLGLFDNLNIRPILVKLLFYPVFFYIVLELFVNVSIFCKYIIKFYLRFTHFSADTIHKKFK